MTDVTVIIPTRNRPVLLARALLSVHAQTGGLTCQCIVVDDGDRSTAARIRQIAAAAGALYCRTCDTGGAGGAAARNRGLDRAEGTFVAFLDDDDSWKRDKLFRQVTLLNSTDGVLCYTGITIIRKNGSRRYSFRKPPFNDHHRAIMRRNFIGTTSSVVIRRSAFAVTGGFDEQLPALQDYDLYIRLLQAGRAIWIDEPLIDYYVEAAPENVSAGTDRFFSAASILSDKYRTSPYYHLLRRYMAEVFFLKCFRSPRFLVSLFRFPGGRS